MVEDLGCERRDSRCTSETPRAESTLECSLQPRGATTEREDLRVLDGVVDRDDVGVFRDESRFERVVDVVPEQQNVGGRIDARQQRVKAATERDPGSEVMAWISQIDLMEHAAARIAHSPGPDEHRSPLEVERIGGLLFPEHLPFDASGRSKLSSGMDHTEFPLAGHVLSLWARVGQTLGVPIPVPESAWSLDAYCELVDRLTATDRPLGWFSDTSDGERLLLRHDVDLDLEIALDHARTVARRCHFATYFFLLRGTTYNLLEERSVAVVREIAACGHRVGIHVDASLYSPSELSAGVRTEISAFEQIVDVTVDSVSFHRPATHPVDYDALDLPVPHAYERRFFDDIAYVSDSRGRWNARELPDSGSLQLLTHPIWWAGDGPTSGDRLRSLLSRRETSFRDAAQGYLSNFDELTG